MLVARLEIWNGHLASRRQIGIVGIANLGRGDDPMDARDYLVVRLPDGGSPQSGVVRSHRRSEGAWTLLHRAVGEGSDPVPAELWDQVAQMVEVLEQTNGGFGHGPHGDPTV